MPPPVRPPQRRQQDRRLPRRSLAERVIIGLLAAGALAAVAAGGWWFFRESSPAAARRDHSPSWSPDSTRIVYAGESGGRADLFVAGRNGGGSQQFTNTPADEGGPAFSPDGRWIAFHSDRDGNFEIYIKRVDSDETHRLTNDPASDQSPAWSRDGTQIVFMSDRGGAPFDLYRMAADGSDVERLTTGGSHWFPQYSPDGGLIALHRDRDVYILTLAARLLRRVTYEPDNGLHPTWSPDGNHIAFMSWRSGRSQIFTARSDGSEQQPVVTMPTGDAMDPRWSPDGRFIAFVHAPNGATTTGGEAAPERMVYVAELSSGRLTRISR